MSDNVTYNVKKIKLSDGNIYSIFDNDALRLDENHKLITGNQFVDKLILEGDLYIAEVDDIPVEQYTNILVQDSTTGQIKGRSKNNLLEDIGGASYAMNTSTGTLSFKIGKQP